jgi:hypothetical protein
MVVARAHSRRTQRQEGARFHRTVASAARALDQLEHQRADVVGSDHQQRVHQAVHRLERERLVAVLLGDSQRALGDPHRFLRLAGAHERLREQHARLHDVGAAAHFFRRGEQLAAFHGRLARALAQLHAGLEPAQLHRHRLARLAHEARRRQDRVARPLHVAPAA